MSFFLRLVSPIFLLFLFNSFHLTAQDCIEGRDSNSFFSYSGVLRDEGGETISGFQTVEMRFELYSVMEGGSQTYSQTMTSVQVTDGIFQIDIGPCLPNLRESTYVQIFVNSDELTPRTKLMVNALSIDSYNSQRLSGLSTSELFTQLDQSILNHLQNYSTNDIAPLVANVSLNLEAHKAFVNNPHDVTKGQVALENVSNDAQLKIASNLSDLNNTNIARTNLGLGSLALQSNNSVILTGGQIDGISIGMTSASTG
ncbi:hypothetical protein MJH12_09260, partial [bacterium]|nr:hypothetical protein [bacterium]